MYLVDDRLGECVLAVQLRSVGVKQVQKLFIEFDFKLELVGETTYVCSCIYYK